LFVAVFSIDKIQKILRNDRQFSICHWSFLVYVFL